MADADPNRTDMKGSMNGGDAALITVKDLHKAFGEQPVLNGINITVAKSETLAVLGRSGTGKSVLLKLLLRLQTADSGSIRVAGKDIGGLHMNELNELRKKIGFLFQQAALYDSLTVEENVKFPLGRHMRISDAEQTQRARELLATVGMDRETTKMPSQISGGMQKRVGLARALALDPEIGLFDEPTAGLDPITAREVSKLILDLREKRRMTAIVVTHDIRNAEILADRLVFLDKGNIRAEGTLSELRQKDDEFVNKFLQETAESKG